ncbi:MAG: DUF512 domain-containing protein [Candidatus Muirbacterium halophilum]|nr:DUF512 domain-containing protein [Candidatus Muirbacterium halophilum]MCK9475432.1 DUF512 domain-containing protein [Candidatus Muirbacterium halophilum]
MKNYLDLDKIKTCRNKCIFCFIDQLPKGLRESLYLKDEDFRYSYIYGNFVTLTSTNQEDLNYIAKMNMSPLYVSVHTMNGKLREKMLSNKFAKDIEEKISFLVKNEISIHAQIVLCPGWNDREELSYSLERLYKYTPYIDSVGIVPFGATCHRKGLVDIKLVEKELAEDTFERVRKFQKIAQKDYGVNWVYMADEFFLKAGKPIPPQYYYDNFPQIENGIGLSRKFLDSFKRSFKKNNIDINKNAYIICSQSSEKILSEIIQKYCLNINIIVVKNRFFGETVTVTGLLTAEDILRTIKGLEKNIPIIIPDIIFNNDNLTLDGIKRKKFEKTDERIKVIGSKGSSLAKFLKRQP